MQIKLNQKEIEQALIAYISNQGVSTSGKTIVVDMTAGRGENGISATIDINNEPETTGKKERKPAAAEPVTEAAPSTGGMFNAHVDSEPVEETESRPLFGG
jgi:hypothetical protein